MSTSSNRAIELAYLGNLPDFSKLVVGAEDYKERYSSAMNYAWRILRFDDAAATAEFITWAGQNGVQTEFNGAEDYHFSTIGQIAWIANNGGELGPDSREWIIKQVAEINEKLAKRVPEITEVPTRKVSKDEILIRRKGEIFGEVDDAIFDGTYSEHLNLATELLKKHQFGKGDADELRERFNEMFVEIKLFGKDEDVTEGYSWMSDEERETYTQTLLSVLADFDSYVQNLTAGRSKSRLKRQARTAVGRAAKRAVRDVAEVQYKARDAELNIDSIDPTAIVGASAALTYNTKKRKISLFVAEPGGLTISGTTIKGFDSRKSVMKAVRKPEEVLPHFRKGNLTRATVMIEKNIKGKLHTDISGRLNNDTLLLKVWK